MVIDDAAQAPPPAPPAFFTTLVAPLLRLVHPTPLSFPPANGPSPHPPMTSALSAVHVSALECLNNIFLSMATSLGGRPSGLALENGRSVFEAVWGALGVVGTDISAAGQERRREMWDIGVGVLWGTGQVWKGALAPTVEQVEVLTQFCNATAEVGVKVKTIGTLECLAQHPDSVDTNRVRRYISYLDRFSRPLLWCPDPETDARSFQRPQFVMALVSGDFHVPFIVATAIRSAPDPNGTTATGRVRAH